MNLNDLLPYFELYKSLKDRGEDTVLHAELQEKEKEFSGSEITVEGIVNEIDIPKNELIITYRNNGDEPDRLKNLVSNHFFIFSSSDQLDVLVSKYGVEKNDLVRVSGNIISLHRQSVLRIQLNTIAVIRKSQGLIHKKDKKGCLTRG